MKRTLLALLLLLLAGCSTSPSPRTCWISVDGQRMIETQADRMTESHEAETGTHCLNIWLHDTRIAWACGRNIEGSCE